MCFDIRRYRLYECCSVIFSYQYLCTKYNFQNCHFQLVENKKLKWPSLFHIFVYKLRWPCVGSDKLSRLFFTSYKNVVKRIVQIFHYFSVSIISVLNDFRLSMYSKLRWEPGRALSTTLFTGVTQTETL